MVISSMPNTDFCPSVSLIASWTDAIKTHLKTSLFINLELEPFHRVCGIDCVLNPSQSHRKQ